jgi:magnesium chelatase subunit I
MSPSPTSSATWIPSRRRAAGTCSPTSSRCTSGLLPRANRGIFAINELPDLSGKIQVGLFNIMQEGDVQIKGYPVRLQLDVLLTFTANPEDYTARGKIITPLKDRIGSEISTHYPRTVALGMQITEQEAWVERGSKPIDLPEFVLEVIERVAFEAREDKRVDRRSGVSQRLPISVLESAVSNAERRALSHREPVVTPRLSDIYSSVPSITGKLELEYEGELQGADTVAKELIRRAAGATLEERMGQIDLESIVSWFDKGGALKVAGDERTAVCLKGFTWCPVWSTPSWPESWPAATSRRASSRPANSSSRVLPPSGASRARRTWATYARGRSGRNRGTARAAWRSGEINQ